MKNLEFSCFNDFESWIEQLKSEQKLARSNTKMPYSKILFRGQRDERWTLSTTLERYPGTTNSLDDYLRIAARVKYQAELHAGTKWPPILGEDGFIIEDDNRSFRAGLPSLEYLVYLRHHGFPSPLLDWTRSPYIAALFAFSECDDADGNVAIYVYQEYAGSAKSYSKDGPFIQSIGPYIDTHKRHTIQQAQYTLCLTQSIQFSTYKHHLHSHENYINADNHDHIYKVTIPKMEKLKVLAKLDQFNLNEYSLYGDEESLMKTLALREFQLKQ